MKIICNIVLNQIDSDNEPVRHCVLTIDPEDPELFEKIKDHIKIFKTIIEQNPKG